MQGVARDMADHQGLAQARAALDRRGSAHTLPPGINLRPLTLAASLTGEMLSPEDTGHGVLLYFHGGGYCTGSAASCRPLCAALAQSTGRAVLAPDYRLAPEAPYPAALDDALASYAWLLLQGYAAADIAVAGDSAGGGLALAMLLAIRADRHGQRLPMPRAAVGICPWLDLACTSNSYQANAASDPLAGADALRLLGKAYAGEHRLQDPLLSPHYAQELAGLCPLLLQVGSAETLLDEVLHFANIAQQSAVPVLCQQWQNMTHVWHSFGELLPEANQALQVIADWLEGYDHQS